MVWRSACVELRDVSIQTSTAIPFIAIHINQDLAKVIWPLKATFYVVKLSLPFVPYNVKLLVIMTVRYTQEIIVNVSVKRL
jgi:hypothetical protein